MSDWHDTAVGWSKNLKKSFQSTLQSTDVRLHVFLVLVNSIEQELYYLKHNENIARTGISTLNGHISKTGKKENKVQLFFDFGSR